MNFVAILDKNVVFFMRLTLHFFNLVSKYIQEYEKGLGIGLLIK